MVEVAEVKANTQQGSHLNQLSRRQLTATTLEWQKIVREEVDRLFADFVRLLRLQVAVGGIVKDRRHRLRPWVWQEQRRRRRRRPPLF